MMENPTKIDDLGVPPIFGNIHIGNQAFNFIWETTVSQPLSHLQSSPSSLFLYLKPPTSLLW